MEEIRNLTFDISGTPEGITRLAERNGCTLSGYEFLELLDSHGVTIDELTPFEPPPDARDPPDILRITVIHGDGRESPVTYGVHAHESDTVRDIRHALLEFVPLMDDETLLLGWCCYTQLQFKCTLILNDSSDISQRQRNDTHMILAAWRVRRAPWYVLCNFASRCIPPVIVPVDQATEHTMTPALKTSIWTAARPFRGTLDCDEFFDGYLLFQHGIICRLQNVSPILLDLGEDVRLDPYRPRIDDSAQFRRSIPVWRHRAIRRLVSNRNADHRIETFFRHVRTSHAASYIISVCGRKLSVRVLAPHGHWVHYTPPLEIEHSIRWNMACLVAEQYHSRMKVGDLLGDVLTMDETAPMAPQPESLVMELHAHQRQNLHFMMDREQNTTFWETMYTKLPRADDTGPHLWHYPVRGSTLEGTGTVWTGGFLSDAMGLGKTVSIIALIAATPSTARATLIIAPPSVLGQWDREIARATRNSMKVLVYHGAKKKTVTYDHVVRDYDVVLTTYATYLLSMETLRYGPWHRVVFDESHTMSDRFARHAPSAENRWCVSATPFENLGRQARALGLPVALYDVSPGYLALQYYALAPLMARHTRGTATLPPVYDTAIPVPFTSRAEETMYKDMHNGTLEILRSFGIRTPSMLVVSAMVNRLRSMCTMGTLVDHAAGDAHTTPNPSLVAPHEDGDMCAICMNTFDKPSITTCGHWFCLDCIASALDYTGPKCPMCRAPQTMDMLRLGVTYESVPCVMDEQEDSTDPPLSSKLVYTIDLVNRIRADDPTAKILVFCPTSESLNVLTPMVSEHGFISRCIHGAMPASQRSRSIASFQNDPATSVFLLSMRSAAAGITLTAANHIIILGPGLSRAAEHQAVGRAHRFGQTRPVHVHRLYMANTVEERMMRALQTTDAWTARSLLDVVVSDGM